LAELLETHHEVFSHPLKLRALDRGEVTGHFAVFLIFQLQAIGAQRLAGFHEATHAVGVRGRTGTHLVVEAVLDITPAGQERLTPGPEALLGRHEFRVLRVRERKAIADAFVKPLLDPTNQLLRIAAGRRA
jgi:hypothetical protein